MAVHRSKWATRKTYYHSCDIFQNGSVAFSYLNICFLIFYDPYRADIAFGGKILVILWYLCQMDNTMSRRIVLRFAKASLIIGHFQNRYHHCWPEYRAWLAFHLVNKDQT